MNVKKKELVFDHSVFRMVFHMYISHIRTSTSLLTNNCEGIRL